MNAFDASQEIDTAAAEVIDPEEEANAYHAQRSVDDEVYINLMFDWEDAIEEDRHRAMTTDAETVGIEEEGDAEVARPDAERGGRDAPEWKEQAARTEDQAAPSEATGGTSYWRNSALLTEDRRLPTETERLRYRYPGW
jgi:hypothetical protein